MACGMSCGLGKGRLRPSHARSRKFYNVCWPLRNRPTNRFTFPGDTVLGVGVETTGIVDVALDRGRRLELYLVDETSRPAVVDNIEQAFLKAFNRGMFQVR